MYCLLFWGVIQKTKLYRSIPKTEIERLAVDHNIRAIIIENGGQVFG